MFDQQSLRPACASMIHLMILCYSLQYSMTVKPLTEQHLGFLSLKGGCTCSSESTHVKIQGRRRVFKSGPAEEIIECRRHERGTPPLVRGLGGLTRENFEFLTLLCAFLMGFYAFGTRFQSRFFARKDISWRVRKPNDKQSRFQIVTIFCFFFLQHIS